MLRAGGLVACLAGELEAPLCPPPDRLQTIRRTGRLGSKVLPGLGRRWRSVGRNFGSDGLLVLVAVFTGDEEEQKKGRTQKKASVVS